MSPDDAAARQRRERMERASHAGTVVIAAFAIVAFLRYAEFVVVTVLASAIIVFALEPVVRFLCRRLRFARSVASFAAVSVMVLALYGIAYSAFSGVRTLVANAPAIAERAQGSPVVRAGVERFNAVSKGLDDFAASFAGISAAKPADGVRRPLLVKEKVEISRRLMASLGSVSTLALSLGFIPFLVYFMLSWKEQLVERICGLFPRKHEARVLGTVDRIETMMQRFLIGNVVVTLIVCSLTAAVFTVIRLPFGIALGVLSGLVGMVPYLGAFLSLVPGLLVALVTYETAWPFVVIVVSVFGLHFAAIHVLVPMMVGGGINLNATVATLAILFFGWLWGGLGLVLGIPVVGIAKCICDNVEGLRHVGHFLGDGRERVPEASSPPAAASASETVASE